IKSGSIRTSRNQHRPKGRSSSKDKERHGGYRHGACAEQRSDRADDRSRRTLRSRVGRATRPRKVVTESDRRTRRAFARRVREHGGGPAIEVPQAARRAAPAGPRVSAQASAANERVPEGENEQGDEPGERTSDRLRGPDTPRDGARQLRRRVPSGGLARR